ncbi:serine/threonine protein phosphatase, putative [Trypanosoma cruzi]|uniref:Serine/threonine protein phosphatase, putative n=1 Tax=Trypanosoma cruzi (strain CL Brener) TaxID=353153 RepID=Q4DJN5_TRYCC|nr:serine/threonine protein phosphatase, putative [Trypanosoma cruzi]EAN92740.1 serine/threonine protein phosphatase, putative [Trypanosoma cruzi]|eukprot:XP_814591.1 serine/threonine protein phosphatase [Trypanosoma cruzi strain CL Brener]
MTIFYFIFAYFLLCFFLLLLFVGLIPPWRRYTRVMEASEEEGVTGCVQVMVARGRHGAGVRERGSRKLPMVRLAVLLNFYFIFGVAFFCTGEEVKSTRKLLTMGLVADTHYDTFPAGEKAPWETMHQWLREQRQRTTAWTVRRYDLARDKMDEAIGLFNRVADMDVVVNLGDLVNNNLMWNLRPILDSFNRAKAPHYSVLGNHDLRAHNDRFGKMNKTQEEWLRKKLGLPRWYYKIDHPPFCLIFLDSLVNDPQTTNATAKEAQAKWLEEELHAAKVAGRVVILFAHFPIGFETNRLGPLLKEYDQMPLVFSGHNHKGDYRIQGAYHVHCVALEGQVETLTNAFAVVEVFEDRAELTGFGRVPSRILRFQPHLIKLLQEYNGSLRTNLSSQGCQPLPPEELWVGEVLQKPPPLRLNIPHYRKPNLSPTLVRFFPKTRFYNDIIVWFNNEKTHNIRGSEEPVDLTSATGKRTLLSNGTSVILETPVVPHELYEEMTSGCGKDTAQPKRRTLTEGANTDNSWKKQWLPTIALWFFLLAFTIGIFFAARRKKRARHREWVAYTER